MAVLETPVRTKRARAPRHGGYAGPGRLRPLLALAAISATLAGALTPALAQLPSLTWTASTLSPRPKPPADSRHEALHALCGKNDAALEAAAARSVQSLVQGEGLLSADDLGFTLRASGDPHVWPRAWSVSGSALEEEDIARRVKGWIDGWSVIGERRCGIARGTKADGVDVIAAVAIDALADMAPLPTTARVGQWVKVEGKMLVPASAVRVVLLGPRGAPKTVVASLSGTTIRSTFSVDQAGPWLVQVLATVSTGPRPVLEAMVFAGMSPPSRFVATPAPGEEAAKDATDDADAMLRMANAARAAEQLPSLSRDADLDKLAQGHAEDMLKAKMVGHDVGKGDLRARIKTSGLRVRIAGENLASAKSLEFAHRALWASPSHRDNLLLDQFKRMGIAVVRAPDGTVWVTEVFAG